MHALGPCYPARQPLAPVTAEFSTSAPASSRPLCRGLPQLDSRAEAKAEPVHAEFKTCPCVFPLRYCLAGLPVGYQFKNITDADVNNLLLEDLIIWTNYEIEVAAYNSAGLGVYSSKVTEWTLQGGGWRL